MKIIINEEEKEAISITLELNGIRYEVAENSDGNVLIYNITRGKGILSIVPNSNNSITLKAEKYK